MNIVLFTSHLDFNVRWNVVTLAHRFPQAQFTILQHAPQKLVGRLVRNQWRNLKRHGLRWIPYQAAEIAGLLGKRFRHSPLPSVDRPGQMFTVEAVLAHPRIKLHRVAEINGPETRAVVAAIAPDLGIALGAPILREPLFSIPRLGTINLHKGRLPEYRGMPPAFWEMANDESTVGCTVHKVEAGLDTGAILMEDSVTIDRFSTVAGVQLKLHRLGVEMICDAVDRIVSGAAVYTPQRAGGKTNTRPSLAEKARIDSTLAAKDPTRGGLLKAAVKQLTFIGYAYGVMPLLNYWHGRTGAQRIIILLYHRVSDQFRDHVTVGIERFDQHMAYIAANFQTVSLKQIVEGTVPRNTTKPIIAVSFDDGYLDNFENAAPILLKHQVPCTFFVSTEKIRDNRPFDHDLRALGFGLDNMSWTQARQMNDWGLHFGSHTQNHVDLAAIDDELALRELEGSLNDLRKELGQEQVFIAFPYGRKKHITKQRVAMMQELGYAACFSAYGGLNAKEMNLFDIKRTGINWAFDLTTLHARLRGWDNTQ